MTKNYTQNGIASNGMKFKFLILFVAIFGIFSTSVALAISPSSIFVNLAPNNPAPYENTTITLSSYAANLDSVTISWFVNGNSALSGIGKKSFSLTTGAAGVEIKVEARIFLPDGEINRNITIRPGVLVLLWQATDSYVPPFYKGKAMPTSEGEIKIVAMPETKVAGSVVSSKNMIYQWKKDYTNMQGGSGYGKNFFTFSNDYLDTSNNVSVVASTIDQKYSSEANINVGTTTPKMVFYRNDATLGTIWERALDDTHQIQNDEKILAIPYFMSPLDLDRPEFTWSWYINDALVNIGSYPQNLIPLKTVEGTSGISKLRVNIENSDKLFGTASKEINIAF